MKLVATLLITLFLLGSAPTADASLADALKDIDQKVLFLYTLRSAPANPSRCTCTVVRKGGCITAAHATVADAANKWPVILCLRFIGHRPRQPGKIWHG